MKPLIYTPDVYEGKDPYICVSFHPSDRERVLPVLEKLDYRGFRFWFNDGIPPGTDALDRPHRFRRRCHSGANQAPDKGIHD